MSGVLNRLTIILCTLIFAALPAVWAADLVSFKEIAMLLRNGEDQRFIIQEIVQRKLFRPLSPEEEQSLLSLHAVPALMNTLHAPAVAASAQEVNAYLARKQQQNSLALQGEQEAQRAAQARLAQPQKMPLPGQPAATGAPPGDFTGKPIDLKFTAADGSAFDLSRLRGKVVLIDFWATWCGPCMREVPHVVAAYTKFHQHNFEIVGISLDTDKNAMLRTAEQKRMTWPQYFDGKGWNNAISSTFHIHAIPAMWLVNKNGIVVTTDAGGNLEANIATLLAQ